MSIIEKVQELQALIVEKYGVQADVSIHLHSTSNPGITRELANDISLDIAKQCSEIWSYSNGKKDDVGWVALYLRSFNFVAFYNTTQDIKAPKEAC